MIIQGQGESPGQGELERCGQGRKGKSQDERGCTTGQGQGPERGVSGHNEVFQREKASIYYRRRATRS